MNDILYQAGQIPLLPTHMMITSDVITDQVDQIMKNIEAVSDVFKNGREDIFYLSVYMLDREDVPVVDERLRAWVGDDVIIQYIGVTALPRGVKIEIQSFSSQLMSKRGDICHNSYRHHSAHTCASTLL